MINAWRVVWHADGKRLRKTFQGDAPRPAIDFAKKLKAKGYLDVEVHSVRKAFAPPLSKRKAPGPGMMWCPYCLKWREFRFMAVKDTKNGTIWAEALRCPVCFISTNDYYVKRYNSGSTVLAHADLEPVKLRVRKTSPASRTRTRRR